VGRDNFGPIHTSHGADSASETGVDWIAAISLVVALIGVVVAVLAWLFPRAPT
jgi:hypothetical protein